MVSPAFSSSESASESEFRGRAPSASESLEISSSSREGLRSLREEPAGFLEEESVLASVRLRFRAEPGSVKNEDIVGGGCVVQKRFLPFWQFV